MADEGIIRRPAVPAPVRIRRDVNGLPPNDPIITFYAKGIEKMRQGELNDPTSWRYQAAIHGYPPEDKVTAAGRKDDPIGGDPFADSKDKLPSAAERKKYWAQCQHHCWFFLPWHRAYLHFFEKILMNIIAKMPGGPKDWALPYWNYTNPKIAGADKLPAPFQADQITDSADPTKKKPNPLHQPQLHIPDRLQDANDGKSFLGAADISVDCVKVEIFGSSLSSFGGAKINHHSFVGGGPEGALESTPHDAVHGALGSTGGFMGGFTTAPLDPIFWLHHCNIDRLWEVWLQRQKQLGHLNRNPNPKTEDDKDDGVKKANQAADQLWLLGGQKLGDLDVPIYFHDANGAPATLTPKDVLNSRAAPLSYEYEDASDPFKGGS